MDFASCLSANKLLIWIISAKEIGVFWERDEISNFKLDCSNARMAIAYSEGIYSTLLFVTESSLVKLTLNTDMSKFH